MNEQLELNDREKELIQDNKILSATLSFRQRTGSSAEQALEKATQVLELTHEDDILTSD